MGQRLVISVIENDEVKAKVYYHWSAYTLDALEERSNLIEDILNEQENDIRLACLRAVQYRGGGLDGGIFNEEELAFCQEHFPNEELNESPNRNNGLIAFTETGMDSLDMWAEGKINIDFTRHEISNDVVWVFNGFEDFKGSARYDYALEMGTIKAEDDESTVIKTLNIDTESCRDFNLEEMSFDDIDDLIYALGNADLNRIMIDCNGNYVEVIY